MFYPSMNNQQHQKWTHKKLLVRHISCYTSGRSRLSTYSSETVNCDKVQQYVSITTTMYTNSFKHWSIKSVSQTQKLFDSSSILSYKSREFATANIKLNQAFITRNTILYINFIDYKLTVHEKERALLCHFTWITHLMLDLWVQPISLESIISIFSLMWTAYNKVDLLIQTISRYLKVTKLQWN